MIVHHQICNYCGEQIEIPESCEEDNFFKKDSLVSRSYGISLDIVVNSVKSYENFRKRNTKSVNFTFCSKVCVCEYLKKSLTEDGKLEN